MDAVFIRAALSALEDWRREADGSRASEARYREQAAELERMAEEHRRDAERAETAADELEQALREQGVEP